MQSALLIGALAAGAASLPHCAAMCGAPCAALATGGRAGSTAFHGGRVLGYAGAGALAAASVDALGRWSVAAPMLRPAWLLLQLAVLAVGLAWVVRAQPPSLLRRARAAIVRVPVGALGGRGHSAVHLARPMAAGIAWTAWPCGSLHAALLLAALADGALGGALVMAVFAFASMPALLFGPWAWSRWQAHRATIAPAAVLARTRWAHRLAGSMLVLASLWVLARGLGGPLAAWCASL